MPLTTGETILNGKYRIVELLGKGAFARVYRARSVGFESLMR